MARLTGATRDASSSGAYFYMENAPWNEGAPIEYEMRLPTEITHTDPISFVCRGKVVRVECLAGRMNGVAVAIESITLAEQQRNRD